VVGELEPLVKARRAQPSTDALSALLRSGGPDSKPVTGAQILGHVNTLMVAGHFTTAALGAYLLFMLVSHPKVLEQVAEEQASAAQPDMAELGRMEHLDNAVMEAERLMPPVPHIARRVVSEIELQGHRLDPGEFLFCSIAGTQRDPQIFAAPDMFDPSRFAAPRNERRGHPLALAGFSVGARRCLGALLAQVTMKVMAHHIIKGFVLHPARPAYPATYRPVLRPLDAMPFHVKARGNAH
jgi:retinoid hydroxylase